MRELEKRIDRKVREEKWGGGAEDGGDNRDKKGEGERELGEGEKKGKKKEEKKRFFLLFSPHL